jgi:hypothetical protein
MCAHVVRRLLPDHVKHAERALKNMVMSRGNAPGKHMTASPFVQALGSGNLDAVRRCPKLTCTTTER